MDAAHFNSLQSFLNAYLIGAESYHIVGSENLPEEIPEEMKRAKKVLVICDKLHVPLFAESVTGFHTFSEAIFTLVGGGEFKRITFSEMVDEICLLENAGHEHSAIFKDRVLSSISTMSDFLESNGEMITNMFGLRDLSFKTTEQALAFGHFSHPYPKLQEKSVLHEAQLNHCINLRWTLVHKKILATEASAQIGVGSAQKIVHSIFQKDFLGAAEIGQHVERQDEYVLFPFHPFQYETLSSSHPVIRHYLDAGLIRPLVTLPEMGSSWIPTTSMRTLYKESCPWMLKFSLDVRLTNSIRILQESEVRRGIQLHEVLLSKKAQPIRDRAELSALTVIHEPFFMAIKDEEGAILKNTIVIFRENPFDGKVRNSICLASLNQSCPQTNKTLLTTLLVKLSHLENSSYEHAAQKWFGSFMENAILPLVALPSRHGIYLGAHQQNLILELSDEGHVRKSFYRDCQGTGYNSLAFDFFKDEAESLNHQNGNVLTQDFANSLMGYYLFINSTLFTIKSICDSDMELERKLLKTFVDRLHSLPGVMDLSFIDYITQSPFILIKDNFTCCLKNINENTIDNPLRIYKPFANPFYLVAHP